MMARDLFLSKWERLNSFPACVYLYASQCVMPAISIALFEKDLLACMYVQCPGGHKRASDPLELEVGTIVSHHVGAVNCTWFPKKAASVLNYRATSSASCCFLLNQNT